MNNNSTEWQNARNYLSQCNFPEIQKTNTEAEFSKILHDGILLCKFLQFAFHQTTGRSEKAWNNLCSNKGLQYPGYQTSSLSQFSLEQNVEFFLYICSKELLIPERLIFRPDELFAKVDMHNVYKLLSFLSQKCDLLKKAYPEAVSFQIYKRSEVKGDDDDLLYAPISAVRNSTVSITNNFNNQFIQKPAPSYTEVYHPMAPETNNSNQTDQIYSRLVENDTHNAVASVSSNLRDTSVKPKLISQKVNSKPKKSKTEQLREKRYHILQEIVSTEQNFVNTSGKINKLSSIFKERQITVDAERHQIFMNFKELEILHTEMVENIRALYSEMKLSKDDPLFDNLVDLKVICDKFYARLCQVYLVYSQNYKLSVNFIKTKQATNDKFRNTLELIMAEEKLKDFKLQVS